MEWTTLIHFFLFNRYDVGNQKSGLRLPFLGRMFLRLLITYNKEIFEMNSSYVSSDGFHLHILFYHLNLVFQKHNNAKSWHFHTLHS